MKLHVEGKGGVYRLSDENGVGRVSVFTTGFPKVDDTRLEGESWLAMRERTEPLRKERQEKIKAFAEELAYAWNKLKEHE